MQPNTSHKIATRVAVIILNWNGEKLLKQFLPSVVDRTPSHSGSWRVIVADNGSTDDSISFLRDKYPRVHIIRFPENYGFAEGYNRAIQSVDDDYVVLLNSDIEVTDDWLTPLVRFMDANPDVAACQPKILSYTDKQSFEYAGACGGYLDRNGYPYCRGRIFSTIETDRHQYDTPATDLHWATGAALIVRRSIYLDAGGLDKQFFAHMEEIDLCWRIRLLGWKIAVEPQSVVYHLGGGSLDPRNPRKTYLNFRNNLLMLHKNLPLADRKDTLLRRRLLDTIAWAKMIASFNFRGAAAIFRAHRHFAKMRNLYPATSATINLIHPAITPNILTQYYLLRHKYWSELLR